MVRSGWGECREEPELRHKVTDRRALQPSLSTGFLRGGTQVGALSQGFLVVIGTGPAPAFTTTDTAHS